MRGPALVASQSFFQNAKAGIAHGMPLAVMALLPRFEADQALKTDRVVVKCDSA